MAIEVVANEACGDEIKVIVDEVGRGRVRVHFIQGMVGRAQGWNACIERARGNGSISYRLAIWFCRVFMGLMKRLFAVRQRL